MVTLATVKVRYEIKERQANKIVDSERSDQSDYAPQGSDDEMLTRLLRETFYYFLLQVSPQKGLIPDTTRPGSPVSITVVGMALSAYIGGVESRLLTRKFAMARSLLILCFFASSKQGTETDATGYQGFYYHFLDMKSGKRAWMSELSTIDTCFFIMGALSVAAYFQGDNPEEVTMASIAGTSPLATDPVRPHLKLTVSNVSFSTTAQTPPTVWVRCQL